MKGPRDVRGRNDHGERLLAARLGFRGPARRSFSGGGRKGSRPLPAAVGLRLNIGRIVGLRRFRHRLDFFKNQRTLPIPVRPFKPLVRKLL